MDRALPDQIHQRRQIKRVMIIVGILALLMLTIMALRSSLRTTISRAQIQTAVAERGAVENTLAASGLILPEFEEVITAPVTAGIAEVFVSEGAQVQPGQSILTLDKETIQMEADKLGDELALRRNGIRKLRLDLEKSLFDLQIRDSIKALNISRLETELDNARRLQQVGGATREQVEQSELDLQIARLEKRQLENELRSKEQSISAELRESELQAQIQERSLRETERKLAQTDLEARRAGVVTWINQALGSTVREGEQLVKIADLGSYRLEGTVADLYADRIRTGMAVLARINDTLLTGTVANIRPTVENDILTFDVRLDNPKHALLRPNLRVEVFIVTERRNDVVRVANGPAFTGQRTQPLFVIRDDRAIRRQVPVGLSNFDYVELRDQIDPGEEVIITDMSDYEHLGQITIK